MARFRKDLHPVNSEKHEQTFSNLASDAGTAPVIIPIVVSVAMADVNSGTEVPRGAHVNWIFFELNFAAQVTTNPKVVHWQVMFNPTSLETSTPLTYNTNNKRFILKRGMEMLPSDTSTVFKRVFVVKIPRKYQRMGVDDNISLIYQATSTETINACGFAIYKYLY